MTVFGELLTIRFSVGTPAAPDDDQRAEVRAIVEEALTALEERLEGAGFLVSQTEV